MPIEREGRFLRWHDMRSADGLGLESSQLEDCVQEVLGSRIRGVFGNPAFGFRESSLDVLKRIPHVNAVWFWDIELHNVDGLYSLHELIDFGVHPKRPPIDFSRLPKLERMVWEYKRQDTGVHVLHALQSLHSWRYRDPSKTFCNLALPPNLTELEINWSNIETLDGIRSLPLLRRLEVHRCRNLRSLGALDKLFPQLEHLVVAACGKVEEGEGHRIMRQHPSLKHAYVKDRALTSTFQQSSCPDKRLS